MDDEETVTIFSLILDIANKTPDRNDSYKLMYNTIFGNPHLKGYWQVLIENGLLNYNPHTQTLKTTEKGLTFLQSYNKMDDGVTK
jgi:predicted transcriptional regulator